MTIGKGQPLSRRAALRGAGACLGLPYLEAMAPRLAAGSMAGRPPLLARSKDGVEWGDYVPFVGKNILRRVAFGDGRFVGVGDRGRWATSTDGRTWVDMPGVKAVDTLVDVAFGGGVFVGAHWKGRMLRSTDGVAWMQVFKAERHVEAVAFSPA